MTSVVLGTEHRSSEAEVSRVGSAGRGSQQRHSHTEGAAAHMVAEPSTEGRSVQGHMAPCEETLPLETEHGKPLQQVCGGRKTIVSLILPLPHFQRLWESALLNLGVISRQDAIVLSEQPTSIDSLHGPL